MDVIYTFYSCFISNDSNASILSAYVNFKMFSILQVLF